ncbi:MAG: hypothetical protein ABFS18_06325, partial [Thermodesulfobacteriota bacterium]
EMSLAAKAGLVVTAPIVAPVALLAAGVNKLIGADDAGEGLVSPEDLSGVSRSAEVDETLNGEKVPEIYAPSISPVAGESSSLVVPSKEALVALVLPGPLAGSEVSVRMKDSSAPLGLPLRSAQTIGPGQLKKKINKAARPDITIPLPVAGPAAVKQVVKPGSTAPAPEFTVVPFAEVVVGKDGDGRTEKVIRAVVGVYGPVAVVVSVGIMLLGRKR